MSKREFGKLFAGWRGIARLDFWLYLPLNPWVGIVLIGAVTAAFIHDVSRIILIPEEIRRRGE